MKKIFTVLISVLMVFALFLPISAENDDNSQMNDGNAIDTVVDIQESEEVSIPIETEEATVEENVEGQKEDLSVETEGTAEIVEETSQDNGFLTANNVIFLDKEILRDDLYKIRSDYSYNLFFGTTNDYTLSNCTYYGFQGYNGYYKLYYQKIENHYNIYLVCDEGNKIYFPEDSSYFFGASWQVNGLGKYLLSVTFKNIDTSYVKNMKEMFHAGFDGRSYSSLTEINGLNNFNTSNVTNMKNMFSFLDDIESIDTSSFDTSNVTTMENMFYHCKNLKSLDLSNFNTSKVTDINWMFHDCDSLESINLSSFNTSGVKYMHGLFTNCKSLKKLDLSNFDVSHVLNFTNMFENCSSLETLDLSSFDDVGNSNLGAMFKDCSSLVSINLSNFNTTGVTNFGDLFNGCKNLVELNLSSFNTSAATTMEYMFYNCSSLKTIYVSEWFVKDSLKSGKNMFYNCVSLVGENGTFFDKNNVGSSYANIDGGFDNPGYLTYKVAATTFKDVDSSTYHSADIVWLANKGISTGWEVAGGKEFRPLEKVARADMAAFIRRLAKYYDISDANTWTPTEEDWNTFTDVDKNGDYHQEDILWLAHAGISSGWTVENGKEFRPLETVARADMAAFIRRLAKLAGVGGASYYNPSSSEWNTFTDVKKNDGDYHQEDILWLANKGISAGWTEGDGTKTFRPLEKVARCDMAAFLYRFSKLM